jgi:hypothetical protein
VRHEAGKRRWVGFGVWEMCGDTQRVCDTQTSHAWMSLVCREVHTCKGVNCSGSKDLSDVNPASAHKATLVEHKGD